MNLIDPILMELKHEMATTRRLLERVPDAHLAWQPHVKSMSLGRLATHIAEIPGWVAGILDKDGFEVGGSYTPRTAGSAGGGLGRVRCRRGAGRGRYSRTEHGAALRNLADHEGGQGDRRDAAHGSDPLAPAQPPHPPPGATLGVPPAAERPAALHLRADGRRTDVARIVFGNMTRESCGNDQEWIRQNDSRTDLRCGSFYPCSATRRPGLRTPTDSTAPHRHRQGRGTQSSTVPPTPPGSESARTLGVHGP